MKNYVVYLTMYSGDKLPKWYIGSSYEEKILKGYNGSVRSKKYKEIYDVEQHLNKHLFKTRILSYHLTREEAVKEELRVQQIHKVMTNHKYVNESYATINGCFGRDVSGVNNPNYGCRMSESGRKSISEFAKTRTGEKNSNFGNTWSDSMRKSLSASKKNKDWVDSIGNESVIKSLLTKSSNLKWFLIKNKDNEIVIPIISNKDMRNMHKRFEHRNIENPIGDSKASRRELKKINKEYLIGWYSEEINISPEEIEIYYRNRQHVEKN